MNLKHTQEEPARYVYYRLQSGDKFERLLVHSFDHAAPVILLHGMVYVKTWVRRAELEQKRIA